jgi:hypothetical protein
MATFRQMNGRRYLLLSLAFLALVPFANSLSGLAQAPPTNTPSINIYPASQIDCSNPPPNINAVQVSSGLETLAEFCAVQGPIQDYQRRDAILWGPSYRLGDFVCRDRRNVDIVCVTPLAAARLRWDIPPQ